MQKGTTMATATASTRKTSAAKAKAKVAARKGSAASKSTAAKATNAKAAKAKNTATKAKSEGPSKREAAAKNDAALTEKIVEARANDEKWSEIATDLSITPGKAQFLMMKHDVAEGNVPAIKHRNENELIAGIKKARTANDAYSSWGWISARSGVAEGKVKALAEDNGMDVRGSNVAVTRAATATNGQTKTGGEAKATAKKSTGASVKDKAKKASAARKAKGSRPISKG
jgi:hypothetical protein